MSLMHYACDPSMRCDLDQRTQRTEHVVWALSTHVFVIWRVRTRHILSVHSDKSRCFVSKASRANVVSSCGTIFDVTLDVHDATGHRRVLFRRRAFSATELASTSN